MKQEIGRWWGNYDITFCADSEACPLRSSCRRHMTDSIEKELLKDGGAVSWAHLGDWFDGECSAYRPLYDPDDAVDFVEDEQ